MVCDEEETMKIADLWNKRISTYERAWIEVIQPCGVLKLAGAVGCGKALLYAAPRSYYRVRTFLCQLTEILRPKNIAQVGEQG